MHAHALKEAHTCAGPSTIPTLHFPTQLLGAMEGEVRISVRGSTAAPPDSWRFLPAPRRPQFQCAASPVFKHLGATKTRQDDRSPSRWVLTNKLEPRCFPGPSSCVQRRQMEPAPRPVWAHLCSAAQLLPVSRCPAQTKAGLSAPSPGTAARRAGKKT